MEKRRPRKTRAIETANISASAVDIGSRELMAAVNPKGMGAPVRSFWHLPCRPSCLVNVIPICAWVQRALTYGTGQQDINKRNTIPKRKTTSSRSAAR